MILVHHLGEFRILLERWPSSAHGRPWWKWHIHLSCLCIIDKISNLWLWFLCQITGSRKSPCACSHPGANWSLWWLRTNTCLIPILVNNVVIIKLFLHHLGDLGCLIEILKFILVDPEYNPLLGVSIFSSGAVIPEPCIHEQCDHIAVGSECRCGYLGYFNGLVGWVLGLYFHGKAVLENSNDAHFLVPWFPPDFTYIKLFNQDFDVLWIFSTEMNSANWDEHFKTSVNTDLEWDVFIIFIVHIAECFPKWLCI